MNHNIKSFKKIINTLEIRRAYLQFEYLSSVGSFLFWWNVAFALVINRTKMSTQCSKRSFKVFTFQFSIWIVHCSKFSVSLCNVTKIRIEIKNSFDFCTAIIKNFTFFLSFESHLLHTDNAFLNEPHLFHWLNSRTIQIAFIVYYPKQLNFIFPPAKKKRIKQIVLKKKKNQFKYRRTQRHCTSF